MLLPSRFSRVRLCATPWTAEQCLTQGLIMGDISANKTRYISRTYS